MEALATSPSSRSFVERRRLEIGATAPDRERRQFANSYEELSHDAMELARAIDSYKLAHRRRFINFEEMLGIIKSLGYSK
jgi:hypothetical protein